MTETTLPEFDTAKFAKLIEGSIAKNARELGISRQHLNNIIKGRRLPSRSLMLKIQKTLNIGLEKIISEN